MKTVKFNEKEYQVPECWCEVTLRMVVEASELSEVLPDAPVVALLSAYTDIPVKELKVSKVQEVNEIMKILDFVYKEYKPEMNNEFKFKGIKYKAKDNITDIEFQDWISIQTILYNYRDNPVRGLPRMLAIIAKRDGETLDDINLDERAELLKGLPFPAAKDLEFFFTSTAIALRSITLLSSMEKEQESIILQRFLELDNMMQKRKEQSGISWLMKLQIGGYQIYLRSLKKDLEKSFNSRVTKISKKNFIQTAKNSYMKLSNENIKVNK